MCIYDCAQPGACTPRGIAARERELREHRERMARRCPTCKGEGYLPATTTAAPSSGKEGP